MDKKYIVYVHIFPNGKKYFGITSKAPNQRWENGKGYDKNHQPVVYSAIQKYGWENIEHKILYQDLIKEEAQELEIYLIAKYKTNCKRYGDDYGYNMTDGGEGTLGRVVSEEQRRKMSEYYTGRTGYLCCNSKQVICDGIEYASLTEFKEKNDVKGAVNCWLNGTKGMPVEWYEKGLHYKNQDTSIIYLQEKPWRDIVIYDGKEYSSQKELAQELNVSCALVCSWLKGKKKVPKEIIKRGLRYKNKENVNLEMKEEKEFPVVEYDGIVFYNQKRLAEYMGGKPSTVNAWIKGRNPIPKHYLEKGFKVIK